MENELKLGDMVRLTKDGNMWCALIGDDLQTGIAGFADNPIQALLELSVELEDLENLSPFLEELREKL
jgi:hypothetical protein